MHVWCDQTKTPVVYKKLAKFIVLDLSVPLLALEPGPFSPHISQIKQLVNSIFSETSHYTLSFHCLFVSHLFSEIGYDYLETELCIVQFSQ